MGWGADPKLANLSLADGRQAGHLSSKTDIHATHFGFLEHCLQGDQGFTLGAGTYGPLQEVRPLRYRVRVARGGPHRRKALAAQEPSKGSASIGACGLGRASGMR